ncbi:MAG: ORF6N domain-containing protein [Bacteroidetes bacterium]|nr:ORF6N domain-containing protein [Bacteroidota bacterium]
MGLTIKQKRIFEIRGHRIMLDFYLAELYNVETRVLNQAVKRNRNRFPPDFMFQLSKSEWEKLKSQIVMSSNSISGNSSQIVMSSKKHRGSKYIPYAFTEHGVAMLSSVLRLKNYN